jgi:uncharacterized membrane protein
MRSPFSPLPLVVFVALLALLVLMVQLGALTVAFDKLGLSPLSAFALLFGSLLGSAVNVPLLWLRAESGAGAGPRPRWQGLLRHPPQEFRGRTLLAVNVGGCVIPVAFSLYLLQYSALSWPQVLTVIGAVTILSYVASRPISGIGIGMPLLLAPAAAALIALMLSPQQSAPLAYVGGTLGVLIGADLLHLPDIRKLGAVQAAIGGAGTFDGIFVTGVVAVLLA